MKLHKLISRTVLATALLGATFGGAFNASASNIPDASVTNGHTQNGSVANGEKSTDNKYSNDNTVSKNFITKDGTTVNITDGYLNLDSTPQFNFGNNKSAVADKTGSDAISQNTLNLPKPEPDNNSNDLQVTDYRASSHNQSGNNNTGWSLSASVSPFNGDNGITSSSNWDLVFQSTENNPQSDMSIQTTLENNTIPSDGSTSKEVMKGGYGSTNVDYSNLVNLHIPYNIKPGNYSSNITWNLSTDISDELN